MVAGNETQVKMKTITFLSILKLLFFVKWEFEKAKYLGKTIQTRLPQFV